MSLVARAGEHWPTHSVLLRDDSYSLERRRLAKTTMEKDLQTSEKPLPCQPSVAFTAQDIKTVPTTNSTKWKQLWAQSQHAYSGRTTFDKS